ncbi:MAG: 16S rRNA (cytosine(967)-C(5))-methyltransferase RsmB [Candidatus Methanoperedenaceae archaeon]|nr:MAG: 16S rRNA (cytosine(967)-C(5))-methyltransferase RsmB [Candidatus Methanoperedenaceae archaeon]
MRKNNVLIRQKTYNSVLLLLDSIFSGKKYPDVLINELFMQEEFSPGEKTVIVELVYGILRHLARLDYIVEHASRARIINLAPNILNSIRICAYQAVFSDSSDAGILNNVVAMSSHNTKLSGFAKRTVEALLKNKDSVIFPGHPIEYILTYHSHPRWIVEKWITELGSVKEVEALCSANNMEPPLTIRVNTLKSDKASLQKMLGEEGYSSSRTKLSPFGLIVDRKEDIFKTRAFKEGFFEVQDEGSQLVTLLTGAKPGELVIDGCAGNGGKSIFLSSLMKNRGTIIASDMSPVKLANLRKRATKAGAFNIKTANKELLTEYEGKGDCVFIDAPCSGMGVFRRNPDSKWRLTPDDIKELAAKQKEILNEYSRLVKPGGKLVYATCTISKQENEDNVCGFLKENNAFYSVPVSEMPGFGFSKLISEDGFFRSMPHIHNTDGFFGAVMIKKQIE